MKVLAYLEAKHSTATTVVGVTSAVSTWIMQHLSFLEGIFRLVATAAGAGIAVITLASKIRAWRARNAPPREPAGVEDDIPFK